MRRLVVLLLLVAVCGASFAAADAGAAGLRARATKQRLKSFPACRNLIGYARHHARREQRGGGGVFAPGTGLVAPTPAPTTQGATPEAATPGSASDSSGTNVQEAGVDEPDFVKSDGSHIFAVSGGRLNAVDARAATPSLLGSIELGSYGGDLLLAGKRAIVISYAPRAVPLGVPQPATGTAQPNIAYGGRSATVITEVDVSDPAAMRIVRTETVDGNYVSARLNGTSARVVISTPPAALQYGTAPGLRTRARGWLPTATVVNRRTGSRRTSRLTPCGQVRHPHVFSGLNALTVLTIDMDKGLPAVDADTILSDGETVYASDDSLYVATQKFVPQPDSSAVPPPPLTTAIHRFDISDPARTTYRSSGEVTGYVLNQFALSEYRGVLRVASTDAPVWWPGTAPPETQSYVTTLKESGGTLLPLGRVGGLGRGERIQAVRFLGAAGYVVTFRQVDPLYTIDLSQPDQPRVAGELKLLGFSAYLHPVGDGLLLGVGQDATPSGRQLGTQLSLFDVSDLSRPQRLSQRRIGSSSSSEVEYDHHAFLYWPATKLAVIPVDIFDGSGDPFLGAIGFRIGLTQIDEVGRVTHTDGQYPSQVRRAVVVGDRLFTVSDLGVKASALSSLADQAFVAFPAQSQSGGSAGQPGVATGTAQPPSARR